MHAILMGVGSLGTAGGVRRGASDKRFKKPHGLPVINDHFTVGTLMLKSRDSDLLIFLSVTHFNLGLGDPYRKRRLKKRKRKSRPRWLFLVKGHNKY